MEQNINPFRRKEREIEGEEEEEEDERRRLHVQFPVEFQFNQFMGAGRVVYPCFCYFSCFPSLLYPTNWSFRGFRTISRTQFTTLIWGALTKLWIRRRRKRRRRKERVERILLIKVTSKQDHWMHRINTNAVPYSVVHFMSMQQQLYNRSYNERGQRHWRGEEQRVDSLTRKYY